MVFLLSLGAVSWMEFTEEICRRFAGSNNSVMNLLREFKTVEQKGSIDEYLEKFEDLKAWVLIRNPTIPKEFFLGFFVEGLKEEIKHTLNMLAPFTLSQAVDNARQKKKVIELANRRSRV